MARSIQRQCPQCGDGIGVARAVATVADRPVIIVTLVCQSCHHEWQIEIDSPPARPVAPAKP